MIRFITTRLFYGFFVLLGAVLVVFFIFNVLPGDPVAMMAGQRTDVSTREAITRELGLDQSIPKQLWLYIQDLSPLSIHKDNQVNKHKYQYHKLFGLNDEVVVVKWPYLRRSFQNNKRVSEIILDNMEGTFWLAFTSMVLATTFGIVFGIIAALKQNSFLDHSLISISIIGISAPPFVLGAVIAMVFGYYLADYTGLNSTGQLWEYEVEGDKLMLKNLILPSVTLALRPLSIIAQLTRSSMLEVLSQDYIRTARAKGLPQRTVILKHALKNALNPVITAASGWLASLMAGAFFIEKVFNWKGLGTVTIDAVYSLDFPVVMGATIFIAFVFIVINILVDILYAAIDPRIRLR